MDYQELVDIYEQLEGTSKRLEKTLILSEFLKRCDDIDKLMLLAQGRVFPNWDQRELGMAGRLVIKAISVASGASVEKIEATWRSTADLGTVAHDLMKTKTQVALFSQNLTVQKVFDNLRKIAELEGEGVVDRKTQLVAELLTSAKPKEAKYIIRTVLGDLRVGLGDGTIRDAICWAYFGEKARVKYDKEKNELDISAKDRVIYDGYCTLIQEAIDTANDSGEVARTAKEKGEEGLRNMSIKVGTPVKVMLFQKAKGIVDGFAAVGRPAAIEYKYDGFRLQVHKYDGKIELFTRRLERVTAQFPDVVASIKECVIGDRFIIDGEAVGFDPKTRKYLPFQNISQRIRRKYDIAALAKDFPVELNLFDVLEANGQVMLKAPFSERRKMLERMVQGKEGALKLAKHINTDNDEVADAFYKASLAEGNEGVMMKNEQEIYKPGSRVGFGVKVKPTMDTLEVVIVGAEWGEGKRGKWLASFIIAVRDTYNESFVEIGRVGTGIKEKEEEGVSFDQLTKLLLPTITEEKGKEVRVHPTVVIEVDYEEIQVSPTYSSGFALRFPRFVKLRDDRSANDVNTLRDLQELAGNQRGRNN